MSFKILRSTFMRALTTQDQKQNDRAFSWFQICSPCPITGNLGQNEANYKRYYSYKTMHATDGEKMVKIPKIQFLTKAYISQGSVMSSSEHEKNSNSAEEGDDAETPKNLLGKEGSIFKEGSTSQLDKSSSLSGPRGPLKGVLVKKVTKLTTTAIAVENNSAEDIVTKDAMDKRIGTKDNKVKRSSGYGSVYGCSAQLSNATKLGNKNFGLLSSRLDDENIFIETLGKSRLSIHAEIEKFKPSFTSYHYK
ncbi:uncharacterized protein LOC119689585 [Teleopsis dalmanni]|uniref:uncharacterized protein LOC119689585 n=1 Tax=Teleopsis dalmanni TaxID=139649 RepID=UPI0018CE3695|nr:uncharacterized protein LOC119689585 [Teleopsis dalmanni]